MRQPRPFFAVHQSTFIRSQGGKEPSILLAPQNSKGTLLPSHFLPSFPRKTSAGQPVAPLGDDGKHQPAQAEPTARTQRDPRTPACRTPSPHAPSGVRAQPSSCNPEAHAARWGAADAKATGCKAGSQGRGEESAWAPLACWWKRVSARRGARPHAVVPGGPGVQEKGLQRQSSGRGTLTWPRSLIHLPPRAAAAGARGPRAAACWRGASLLVLRS